MSSDTHVIAALSVRHDRRSRVGAQLCVLALCGGRSNGAAALCGLQSRAAALALCVRCVAALASIGVAHGWRRSWLCVCGAGARFHGARFHRRRSLCGWAVCASTCYRALCVQRRSHIRPLWVWGSTCIAAALVRAGKRSYIRAHCWPV